MIIPLLVGGGLIAYFASQKKEGDSETGYEEEDTRISPDDFVPGASVPHSKNGNVKKGVSVARAAVQAGTAFIPGLDDETQEGISELSESLSEAAPKATTKAAKEKKPKKPKKAAKPKKVKAPKAPKAPNTKKAARQAKTATKKAAKTAKKATKKKSE